MSLVPPPPALLAGSARPSPPSRTSTTPSTSTHTPTENWNDLPADYLPSSKASSRSVSPFPGTTDSTSFLPTIKSLFTGGTLPEREKTALYGRVVKAAPGVEERLKVEIEAVVKGVMEGGIAKADGREMVLEVIKREQGVSAWAPAIRRGVEGWKE